MRNWIRRVFARDKADATIVRTGAASTPDSITDDQADPVANAPQAHVGAVPEILLHAGWSDDRGWKPGSTMLGLYQVKATIRGGMGVIHRVRHLGWDMDLAVKVPRPEFFRTQHQKNLFTAECERWVNLGLHPNVVSCYYVRLIEDIPAVFAEWIDGGSLSDWIDSRRLYEGDSRENLLRILDIAIQFAWGLNYAHNKAVVHQDVKPSNLMVDPEGIAKITDFGIARAAASMSPLMTAPSVGDLYVESGGSTLPYRSPEQAAWRESSARKTASLSHKTDIWSWAVSVLEMFCGGLRWEDGLVAAEVLRETKRRGSHFSIARSIPPAVYGLLEQCLQVDPGVRPNSMVDVVNALVPVYEATAGQPYPRARIKRAARGEAESANPSINVRITKNREPKRIQLPDIAVDALRALPSYGHHEYVFPAKANPRFRGNFKKPHAWDLGKRFRRVAEVLGIKELRIHDLRHFTASTLTAEGVADNIISLLTGHKSRELRRYQHLREDLKRGTVDLIAKTLEDAQRNSKDRNGASSAHPLHTGSKTEKKRTGKDSK